MRLLVLAISIGLCLGTVQARAFDWTLRSTLSESVEFNDNQFLNTVPRGTIGSYSNVTGNAEARTASSRFIFDGYFNYRKYWGPGTEGVPQTENVAYGVGGKYELFGKDTTNRVFVESRFNSQSLAFALLNQLGILLNTPATINQVLTTAGIDRALSARDTVNLSGQVSRSFYDPDAAGTAFNDMQVTGAWQHRISPAVAVSLTSQAQFLEYENAARSSILILRNQAGIDATLSPVLSFRGNAGAAYVDVQNGTNALTPTVVGSGQANSGHSSNVGFITDMLLTYKALKSTTFTLAGTQSIGPTLVGSLFQTATIRAGVAHQVNALTTVSLAADVSRTTSTNSTDFASASITYSRQLTRDWTAQVSYRFLHRLASTGAAVFDPITGTPIISGTGPASSNSLLFVLTKSITLLPPGGS